MTRFLAGAAVAALLVSPAMAADVRIGVPNWAAAEAISYMIDTLVEQETGLEVERIASTNPVIFKAMDSGDMDIHPDVWLPNQKNLTEKYVDTEKTVALSENTYDGFAGFCVTKKTAEDLGIKSIYDLANPELAKKFDTNGDGKGEVWVGASGWAGTAIDTVRLTSYGVGETFEILEMDEALAIARIKEADAAGSYFATLCFAPHMMFQLAELVQLEEPAYEESKWTMVQPTEDPDWLAKSNIEVAYPPIKIQIAYATRLAEAHPRVGEILRGIQLDTAMINDWNYKIVEQKRDAEEVVDEWMTANPDRVKGWLGF